MKKIMMIAMLIIGSIAFGRDFDHKEKADAKILMEGTLMNQEMVSREREIGKNNMENYSYFHWELMTMDRGESDR